MIKGEGIVKSVLEQRILRDGFPKKIIEHIKTEEACKKKLEELQDSFYIFKVNNDYAVLMQNYCITLSHFIYAKNGKSLCFLFTRGPDCSRVYETISNLICKNYRKVCGGYYRFINYEGFYEFEPVIMNKEGKIVEILSCTPIENLLTNKKRKKIISELLSRM